MSSYNINFILFTMLVFFKNNIHFQILDGLEVLSLLENSSTTHGYILLGLHCFCSLKSVISVDADGTHIVF